jgi:mannosyltransferase OCH1-like enzyme
LAKEDGVTSACEMIERYLGRLDAQGHLPSIYELYTPPLTPRKRSGAIEANTANVKTSQPVSPKLAVTETALGKPILILFYNLMWNQPLNFDALDLPADCRWTTDRRLFDQADAVVFHIPDLEDIHNLVKPSGQIWVAWSQECELHYPQITDSNLIRRFDLTISYKRHSDIPNPYYGVDMLRTFQSPPHPKTQSAPAVLFLSSPFNQSGRYEFLDELMRYLKVHSYGNQLKNMSLENDRGTRDKLAVIANYKFTLALENAVAPDYVTEKFFDPLMVGSVPIYLGAPNINEFAPGKHCFINAADFESPQALADYVIKLDADDAAFNEYLAWRSQPLRAEFVRMLEAVREPFLVRLYRRVREIQALRNTHATDLSTHTVSAQETTQRNPSDKIPGLHPSIPKILHQTWKDKNIPAHLVAYCESWKTHHPDWEFKLWTDIDNREFIRQNYSWFLPIFDGYPENIMRADAVRYFILYHYGGVYADLDAECLRPLDSILVDRQLLLGLEPPLHNRSADAKRYGLENVIGNAVIASVPQHPLWEHVFKSLVGFHQAQSALVATGPCFLTLACQAYHHPEEISIAPHELFYPITNEKPWSELPLELQTNITQTAFTIHHWMSSWFKPEAQDSQQAQLSLLVHGQLINKMTMSVDQYRALLATCTTLPKISCLMVTKNRTEMAKQGIHCFCQQTYSNRELVIIDDSPDDSLEQFVKQLADPQINYVHLPNENRSLGELRNQAVTYATGSYIAQWDDDDLSDPLRLEVQMAVIHALQTDACLLERQQILWLASRRLAVSTRRLWESSFLCAKAKMPAFPVRRRGEDTPVIEEMVDHGRIGLLDLALLYTYVFHGENTVDADLREKHWLMATESFEGPLFDVALEQLRKRLHINQW